jgi:hypothetical protein
MPGPRLLYRLRWPARRTVRHRAASGRRPSGVRARDAEVSLGIVGE